MQAVTTIGLDIAKSVFQVHGVDAEDNVIIRRQCDHPAQAEAALRRCFLPEAAVVSRWYRGLRVISLLVARAPGARRSRVRRIISPCRAFSAGYPA